MFSLGTEAPRAFLPLVDISPRRLSSSCLRGLGCRRASGYEAIGWGEVLTIVGDSVQECSCGAVCSDGGAPELHLADASYSHSKEIAS